MERDLLKLHPRGSLKIITRKEENGRTFYQNKSSGQEISYVQEDLPDLIDGFLGQIKSLAGALNADGSADPTYLLDTLVTHIDFELEKIWAAINREIGEITIDRVSDELSGGYIGQVLGASIE